jgi:cytoskeletal protein RodZ
MNEIEKRELIEQRRKIFEAGTQRADKRTGSFSFLTWPFFIAPLIAGEEFLAATFKSAAAKEQDAKALQAGAAPRAANDDPPVSDPSKANAENETTKGPAASSDAHAAQLDLNGLSAQSDEDAPKLSAAHSEAVVAASDESGGGGGDVAESRHHDAHTSIDDSSVNSLLADSHFGSGQLQGGSTVEALHSNGLADLFNPSIGGSAPCLEPLVVRAMTWWEGSHRSRRRCRRCSRR